MHHRSSDRARPLLDFRSTPYLAIVYDLDVGPGATLAHIRIIEDSRAAESLSVIEARVAAGGVY
ncbi:hypothetical protein, partial [Sorlinia euscelidii]|uniref:hypothetical protein n=1 Tax=Sorlinia euscelidii TaxID=3081148 RepID=UPI00374E10C0